jgi:LacI family transcriptional regulator
VTSILDVAKKAGVSPTTAKRAVNHPHLLTKATLERVQTAIETLNYEPDRTAGALRRGHSQTIGLMVGNIIEPFFAQLTRTIAKAIHAKGYALIVADNEYDTTLELENLRMFHGQRVSGLIIRSAFGTGNLEYLKRLHQQGTYILEIDHFLPESGFSHIMLDNHGGVETGMRYLHSLGHKKIAALTVFDANKFQDERARAYTEIMTSLGLKIPKAYQRSTDLTEEGAYQRTLELLRLPEPPTAIFSMTGNEAAGAFRALKEQQIRIPEDISFLTFDDYSWTSLVEPPLDVITQPIQDMGLRAAELVINAIERRQLNDQHLERFPCRLIRRSSCAAPRQQARLPTPKNH